MSSLSYYDGIISAYPGKISEYDKKIENYTSVKPLLSSYISSLDNIIDTLRNTSDIATTSVIINKKSIDDGEIDEFVVSFQSIRDDMSRLHDECNQKIEYYEQEKINAKNEYNSAIDGRNRLIAANNKAKASTKTASGSSNSGGKPRGSANRK